MESFVSRWSHAENKLPFQFNPSPLIESNILFFPGPNRGGGQLDPTVVPRFDPSQDPDGVTSHVPHMEHFYENSLQTGLMRDLAIDLELLNEHLVLLGNQVRDACAPYNSCCLHTCYAGSGEKQDCGSVRGSLFCQVSTNSIVCQ